MNKTIRILAALLVVQIIVVAVVFVVTQSGPASASSEPLLPDLKADNVVRLTVQDADGNQVQLAKKASDWVLPDADDYPVQSQRVTDLLDKITSLKTNRLVTKTSASHKRLQVSDRDFVRRLDIETGDGHKYILFLGSSPQARATHVRVANQDEVYLATNLSSFDVGARSTFWVDTEYFTLNSADVISLTLKNANGEFVFQKDEAGNWTLADLVEGETTNSANVTTLINRLSAVRLTQPLGREAKPEYGLDNPLAEVTVVTKSDDTEPVTHTLKVGTYNADDKSYVVASSQSPYIVRVAEYSVKDLVEKARGDFLSQPTPTPTPAGPAEPQPTQTPTS